MTRPDQESSATPKLEPFLCLQCGNQNRHDVLGVFYEPAYDDEGDLIDEYRHVFAKCNTCGQASLYLDIEDAYSETLWPVSSFLGASVPQRVRELYKEAQHVKSRSPSLFAVQIRRTMEAMCHDKGYQGKTLSENLNKLALDLGLPDVIASLARVNRVLGNKGAHGAEDVTDAEADTMGEFFLALIEYVYVAPDKLARYEAALTRMGQV